MPAISFPVIVLAEVVVNVIAFDVMLINSTSYNGSPTTSVIFLGIVVVNNICDVNCNPTDGTFRASWTYTAGTPSNWKIRLEYSFNYGSSYTVFNDNIDITTSPFTDSLNGVSGFT